MRCWPWQLELAADLGVHSLWHQSLVSLPSGSTCSSPQSMRATLQNQWTSMMPEAGRQFRFIRPIASGGFGTVYLAKEEHADGFSRVVAVKLLNAQWTDSEEIGGRIRDEARLLGLLRHRNIVDVYDLTSLDGRSAVVMEFLEAVDLRYLIQHLEGVSQRIPVRVALEIVAQVAHALDAAYNRPPMKGDKPLRVIHRDIKPSNIMLDAHGLPKVLDFGVDQSDIVSRESNTQELQFGSVDYMAPERLFFEPETPASDVYSLAATLFELITGERLGKAQGRASKHDAHLAARMSFLRGSTSASPEVAAALEALLLHTLHFEHDHRPDAATFCQDARQLARRIQEDDLVIWSERVMPGVVEAAQSRAEDAEELSNAILTEDSVVREMNTGEMPSVRDVPEPVTARESARAAALRRGALAELERSSDIEIAPATGAPQDGGGAKMSDLTDGVGWNDRTMGDLTDAQMSPTDVPEPPHPLGDYDEIQQPPAVQVANELHTETVEKSVTEVDTLQGLSPVAPKTSWTYLVAGAALPLMAVLGLGTLAVWQDWGGLRGVLIGDAPAPPVKVVEPTPSADDAPEASLAAGADEGGILIRSAWPRTTATRVRCKEDSAKGRTEARLDREAASRCSVTAMREDRTRITAVLDVASEGTWVCFEDGAKECRDQ